MMAVAKAVAYALLIKIGEEMEGVYTNVSESICHEEKGAYPWDVVSDVRPLYLLVETQE
jgi:hypothetical protein